jgi:hypothetical protein
MFYDGKIEADLFRFPDFVLKVGGEPSPVREAVGTLFQLFPNSADDGLKQIDMHVSDFLEDGSTVLPQYMAKFLCEPELVAEPMQVHGENGAIGFIHAHDDVFTACYYMPERSRIELVATRKKIGFTPLCITSVLVPLLRELLLDHHQVLLHSAAIACPDGTGILLLADSGGGKTTTSLSLLRLGAKLLGDDLIALGDEQGALTLHGFPEPMNLSEQTIGFFEELAGVDISVPIVNAKRVVSPLELYGSNCMADSIPLHVVYWVSKSDGTPRIQPLSPQESLGILLRAHTFARCQQISKKALDTIYRLLDSTKIYRLYTGSNPAELGNWLLHSARDHANGRDVR